MAELIRELNSLSWPGAFAMVGVCACIVWLIKDTNKGTQDGDDY